MTEDNTARVVYAEDGAIEIPVECSSEEGITIGLIDTIMTAANALQGRKLVSPAIVEALRDLHSNRPLQGLLLTAVGFTKEKVFQLYDVHCLEEAMLPCDRVGNPL